MKVSYPNVETIGITEASTLEVPAAGAGGAPPDVTAAVLIDRAAYADDAAALQALQDAVDAGGTVVVKGTFALEPEQRLSVGARGNHATIKASPEGATLVGGTDTISQVRAVDMRLEGLGIRGSRGTYIFVQATAGTTVRDSVLTGLVPDRDRGAVGIQVSDFGGAAADVRILNNVIDAGNAPWSFPSQANCGILFNRAQGRFTAAILGNRIEGSQTAGIFVNESTGAFLIGKNRIVVAGDPEKGQVFWAAGIWGRSDNGLGPASFTVVHNEIEAANSVFAIGYGNFMPNPQIVSVSHNRVVFDQTRPGVVSALLTHGNVDGSVWQHNVISGPTVNAIAMVVGKWGPAEGNLFYQNQIDVELRPAPRHPSFPALPLSHLYFGPGADNNIGMGFEGLRRRRRTSHGVSRRLDKPSGMR